MDAIHNDEERELAAAMASEQAEFEAFAKDFDAHGGALAAPVGRKPRSGVGASRRA